MKTMRILSATCLVLSLLSSSRAFAREGVDAHQEVFFQGLDNPRGLKFGPDGDLYVAEGGTGGSLKTIGTCQQVPMVGPYSGGFTSRISRIDRHGHRTTIVEGLPSSQTNPPSGGLVSGVADIAFLDGVLYGVEAGAGCSHGLAGTDNVVFRVNPNGTVTTVANLSVYQKANPVADPEPDDFEPDGTWYSMIALHGKLYAVEPNHGELVEISPRGAIRRIVDVSANEGHVVPTALTFHDGRFFIGNLNTFPVTPGSSHVYRVTQHGRIRIDTSNVTTVLGVAFDDRGRLYVLEMSPAAGGPTPFIGRVLRFERDDRDDRDDDHDRDHGASHRSPEVIADGLAFPTAMTFGPDGRLYVSNFGFGFPGGAGQIVRITVPK